MRIDQLTPEQVPPGTQVRVTYVAPSEAETLGYVHDTEQLLGKTGKVTRLRPGTFAQLELEWDDAEVTLMLAGKDEVEVIGRTDHPGDDVDQRQRT